MTVVTYLDKLKDESDKENVFDMASSTIGSSSERTYFITNYTHEKNEQSSVVERTALDILDSVLLSAESFIRIKKQQEKNQMEKEIAAGGEIRMMVDHLEMTSYSKLSIVNIFNASYTLIPILNPFLSIVNCFNTSKYIFSFVFTFLFVTQQTKSHSVETLLLNRYYYYYYYCYYYYYYYYIYYYYSRIHDCMLKAKLATQGA